MRWVTVILAAVASSLAVGGAALTHPWTVVLPAGLGAGLWVLLALRRPTSRIHVLPMLLCVGGCAVLAAADATRLCGLVGLPLALFAWDATVVLRGMSRFSAFVPPSAVLRYAAAVAGIGAAAVAAAVGGRALPVALTFPAALGFSVLLLALAIALLATTRRPAAASSRGEKQEADAPEGTSAHHGPQSS
jgi:hypothetical protein